MFKKFFILAIAIMMIMASPAFAMKFSVDSTRIDQFHSLNVTRASGSTVNGGVATIDLSTLSQSSASGAVEVVELSQSDLDQAFIKFTCTEGAMNCNSSYTSTNSTKAGAIRVDINGTARWVQFFDAPN